MRLSFKERLNSSINRNRSFLCIGLDLDYNRLPEGFSKDSKGILKYGKMIIDITKDLVAVYKPNIAFFESLGVKGIETLQRLIEYIPNNIPVILDAKRADIGNTSKHYAKSVFDILNADAVTVNPYMGYDSLLPFFERKERYIFVLVLTSNEGAKDFEMLKCNGEPLFLKVAKKIKEWNFNKNIGAVVGATKSEDLKLVRDILKEEVFLIPGIGAQGGDINKAIKNSVTKKGLSLFNVSRDIIFAGSLEDIRNRAEEYKKITEKAFERYGYNKNNH